MEDQMKTGLTFRNLFLDTILKAAEPTPSAEDNFIAKEKLDDLNFFIE